MNSNYIKTGNNIEVPFDELKKYVINLLHEYKKNNHTADQINPYSDPIIYKTSDGKFLQIPQNIQKQAIDEYNKSLMLIGYDLVSDIPTLEQVEKPIAINQDDLYASSIRPFDRFDSMNVPHNSDPSEEQQCVGNVCTRRILHQSQKTSVEQKNEPEENNNIQEQTIKKDRNYVYYIIGLLLLIAIIYFIMKTKYKF